MATRTRKPSKGRQKIEIKRIQSDQARQVCFCKRRRVIFKKASELSVLCGAEVGVLVFSPGGRPFSFGHPSLGHLIDCFTAANTAQEPTRPIRWNANVEKLGLEDLLAFEKAIVELRNGLQARTAAAADRVSAPKADLAIVRFGMPAPTSSSVSSV